MCTRSTKVIDVTPSSLSAPHPLLLNDSFDCMWKITGTILLKTAMWVCKLMSLAQRILLKYIMSMLKVIDSMALSRAVTTFLMPVPRCLLKHVCFR